MAPPSRSQIGSLSALLTRAVHTGNFVKIALNVARRQGQLRNVLPDVLWSWFGPDAGQPGTAHFVERPSAGTGICGPPRLRPPTMKPSAERNHLSHG